MGIDYKLNLLYIKNVEFVLTERRNSNNGKGKI